MNFNFAEALKVVKTSLKSAINWSFWKWICTGSFGALCAVLQFGDKFFNIGIKRSVLYATLSLTILFIIRFILIFIKESLKYFHEIYQNSLYGDAIVILKESFSHLHNYRKVNGHRDEDFMKTMILFCDNLKIIFEKILGTSCCVSIKVPLQSESVNTNTVLVNLTRDTETKNRDSEDSKKTKHTLIGNTAFVYTFSKVMDNSKEKYYINNDVNNTKNYQSTSKMCYEEGKLPYNSELVIPIVPILRDSISKNSDCHGFICVDSVKFGSFTPKYHVAILEGVADGIYDLISERNKTLKNIE